MRSILLCLGFLCGCSGLWGAFLGEAPEREGGPADGGADQALPAEMTCAPSERVRGSNGSFVQIARNLYGVWGAHDNAVWAVGESGLILRWDGSGVWQAESESGPHLYAVWGPDDSFVAAASQDQTVLRRSPIGAWGPQPISGLVGALQDITGVGDGTQLAGGLGGGVLQYDGTRWSPQATLSPGTGFAVHALAMQDATRVAVTGSSPAGGFIGVYGEGPQAWSPTWSMDTLPSPIYGAVFVGSEVFAVDATGTLTRYGMFGGGTKVTVSDTLIRRLKPAVHAGHFWAVGDGGMLSYWDGTALVSRASGTSQHLHDVWQSPTGILWAVGRGGTIVRCTPPAGPS